MVQAAQPWACEAMLYLIIKEAVSGVMVALGRAQSASLEPGASNGES